MMDSRGDMVDGGIAETKMICLQVVSVFYMTIISVQIGSILRTWPLLYVATFDILQILCFILAGRDTLYTMLYVMVHNANPSFVLLILT